MASAQEPATTGHRGSVMPYVAPIVLFTALTTVEGSFPRWYVGLYILKAALVSGCLIVYRDVLRDYRPEWRVVLPAVLVGLLIFLIWIPLDRITPFRLPLSKRTAFNPFTEIHSPVVRALFLAVRFYGLVILVPTIEELFFRSFLIRYASVTDGEFQKLPIGTFTWGAFALVAALFAAVHPEWLSALVCAVAYGLLLKSTKSLFAVGTAHAVTNLVLGIYIIAANKWIYW